MVSALASNFSPPSNTDSDGRKKGQQTRTSALARAPERVLWPSHWISCLASVDYSFRLKNKNKNKQTRHP